MTLPLLLLATCAVSTVLLAWHFAGYPLVMGLVTLSTDRDRPELDERPFVSILVPSYNEASVIRDRVENLASLAYPDDRYEVIFVDSDSDDGTADVLRDALAGVDSPRMALLEEDERRGKASAINLGLESATGEIVLVTDANTTFDETVLDAIVPHFADSSVGGVTGGFAVPDSGDGLAATNQFYRELEQLKDMGEARLDSACQLYGEMSAWRKDIATADTNSLSEDLDLSLEIRRQGYRIAYEPDAIAYEPEPSTPTEQVVAGKRRLIGVLQALVDHWRFLGKTTDYYRGVIFPSRKTMQVLSPFLFVAVVASVVGLALLGEARLLLGYVVATLIGTVLTGSALLTVKSRSIPDGSDGGISIDFVPSVVYYLALMEYAIVLAWKDFVVGAYSVLWQKSSSDR